MPSTESLLEQRIGKGSLGALLLQIEIRHAAKPNEPVKNFIYLAAEEGDEDAKLVIESGILALGTDP